MKDDIKEKLEVFDEYALSDMTDAPDTLKERMSALQPSPPEKCKRRMSQKSRAGLRIAVASFAAAALVIGIALPVYFSGSGASPDPGLSSHPSAPGPNEPDGSGTGYDPSDTPQSPNGEGVAGENPGAINPDTVEATEVSYAAFLDTHDVYLPEKKYTSAKAYVAKKDGDEKYAHVVYMYGDERLDVTIAYGSYEVDGQDSYAYADKDGKFGSVSYKYSVNAKLKYAMATFTYASARYYISYYSKTPDAITDIMNTFKLQ